MYILTYVSVILWILLCFTNVRSVWVNPALIGCNEDQERVTQCLEARGVCKFHTGTGLPLCICLCIPGQGQAAGKRCEGSLPFSSCGSTGFLTKLINDISNMENKFLNKEDEIKEIIEGISERVLYPKKLPKNKIKIGETTEGTLNGEMIIGEGDVKYN